MFKGSKGGKIGDCVCKCPHGSPKTGAACTKDGAAMCESCNPEFTSNADQTECLAVTTTTTTTTTTTSTTTTPTTTTTTTTTTAEVKCPAYKTFPTGVEGGSSDPCKPAASFQLSSTTD